MLNFSALAQQNNDAISLSFITKEKDIVDISKSLFNKHNKKDSVIKDSSNKYFSLVPAVGYSMSTGLTGVLASNLSFYLESDRKKLSSISTSAYYTQYNQYWLLINSNITSEKLKLNFTGDWRLYKFPSTTFRLGSTNSLEESMSIDYKYFKFHEIISKKIEQNFYIGLGYHLDYHWDIFYSDSSNNVYSELINYGVKSKSTTSGISANLLFDSRDNSVNSKHGTYIDLKYIFNNTFIMSENNAQILNIDF